MSSNEPQSARFGRRSYLKGCLVGAGSALALSGVTSASDDTLEDQYRTVIDVTEEGADDTGNESVTPVIQRLVDDDTLLKFPEGRYYMDEQVRFTSFENVGLVGDRATLVPANYHNFQGPQYRLFRFGTAKNPGRDLHFEKFTVDQRAKDTGIRVINAEVEDGLYVGRIGIYGLHDSGTWGPGLFNVLEPSGTGLVECFRAYGGGIHVDETPNSGNMWRGPTGIHVNNHHGSLVLRDCTLGGFPGTGLYESTENGALDIQGGYFENSATASIRLAGARASINDAVIVVDDNPSYAAGQHPIRVDKGGTFEIDGVEIRMPKPNGDAIRIMDGVNSTSIANTSISIGNRENSGIRLDSGGGPMSAENVDIDIDGSGYAFRLLGDDEDVVTLRDVAITGDASGSPLRHTVFCERSNCRFHNLSIDQPGEDRGGLELRGDNYQITESEFRTDHIPVVVNGSDDVVIEDSYSESYGDRASLLILDGSSNVSLQNNDFPGGVKDKR
ncbi:hypothetical protein [Natronosalvus caseinilyticus]|uniref:hypothetical protein n=1 Tax=Natronosalvus caseinilyticus TaxID=2953747 RepID=UPI0028A61CFE|nr:hypothetical protein [Natronosalvus caseinilyticus]